MIRDESKRPLSRLLTERGKKKVREKERIKNCWSNTSRLRKKGENGVPNCFFSSKSIFYPFFLGGGRREEDTNSFLPNKWESPLYQFKTVRRSTKHPSTPPHLYAYLDKKLNQRVSTRFCFFLRQTVLSFFSQLEVKPGLKQIYATVHPMEHPPHRPYPRTNKQEQRGSEVRRQQH